MLPIVTSEAPDHHGIDRQRPIDQPLIHQGGQRGLGKVHPAQPFRDLRGHAFGQIRPLKPRQHLIDQPIGR